MRKLIAMWNLWFHGRYVNKHGITVQYVKQPVSSLFTGRKYFKLTRYAIKKGYRWDPSQRGVVVKTETMQRRANAWFERNFTLKTGGQRARAA
jgi:hypothetical protein